MPETLAAAQARITAELAAAGIDGAALDARVLLQRVLGLAPGALVAAPERQLTAPEQAALGAAVARRTAREPLAYIVGEREFWSLDFSVAPGVLIPRPDSETLVAAALDLLPVAAPARVLDLGTGSGCLLLAVLSERPHAAGFGIDLSHRAAAIARGNARRAGVPGRAVFAVGDWASAVAGTFDLVLCNPPYVETGTLTGLMPEVADHEPRAALDGGPRGLDAYARILPQLSRLLAPGGHAVIEIGADQATAVAALATANHLTSAPPRRDLAGRDRCLVVTADL